MLSLTAGTYFASFTEIKSLNNWSSGEYSSIRRVCFWAAFPNWYACSTTAEVKTVFSLGILLGKNSFSQNYGWRQLVNWFFNRNTWSSKIEMKSEAKINQIQVQSKGQFILPSEPTICLRRAATCPWREEINSTCCSLDAAKQRRKC